MNVLLLEDDHMLRKALAFHLLEEGHTVTAAENGAEALKLLEATRDIHVIICDVMMPELSGPSFLLSIRRIFPKKLPTIIIITSVKKGDEFLKEIEIPYDFYLQKPINFEDLTKIINAIPRG